MQSTGRDVRVALAALVLVLLACGTSARGSDLPEQLRGLFDLGGKGTPSAVAAAKAKYDALQAAHANDPRIDYAYGVVLINQRKYREAIEILARYLATDKPRLTAYCLQIGALVPLREGGKVLEQAVALANRLNAEAGNAPETSQADAARFLGTVFRYLELSRKGFVDTRLLNESKSEVLALLDERCTAAYEEGYNATAKRHSELQAQYKSQQEQIREKLTDRKERDKLTVEQAKSTTEAADEKSLFTQEQLREVQQQYTELQKQMTPFVMQRSILQSAIVARETQIELNRKSREPNPDVARALQNEIELLRRQFKQLDVRLAPLRASAATLEAKAASHNFSLARAEDTALRSERLRIQANRRIERAEDKLNSRPTAAEGKLTLFSSYAPFSYEFERKRVLDWFPK
jgi:hypothetical protein